MMRFLLSDIVRSIEATYNVFFSKSSSAMIVIPLQHIENYKIDSVVKDKNNLLITLKKDESICYDNKSL